MRVRKKLRRIRRLGYLGLLIGAVVALRKAKAARDARTVLGPPAAWPPLEPGEAPVAAVGDLMADAPATPVEIRTNGTADALVASEEPVAAVGALAADDPPPWVPAADGSCPVTHPVKANTNSGIYHLPGGQFYGRTNAERCYVDAAAAEADGYRAAKRTSNDVSPTSPTSENGS
jgi:hypothetical protein